MSKSLQPGQMTQKMRFSRLQLFGIVALLTTLGIIFVLRLKASTASLYFNPSSLTVAQNATFSVAVRVNSGTDPVNAVQANVSYPAASLSVLGISYSGSAFSVQAQETQTAGLIKMARGTQGGAPAVSGDQLFATITFQTKAVSGSASLSFATGSAAIRSTDNTDITSSTGTSTITIGSVSPPPPPPPDTTKPTAPTNLTATAPSSTQVNLTWTASTDNVGVTGYNVIRGGVKVATIDCAVSACGATVSFGQTGLTPATTYSYSTTAYDAAGNISNPSNTVTITTPSGPCPRRTQGDLNCNGAIDGQDLSLILRLYGTTDPSADVNGDGQSNGQDLSIILRNYGT